MGSQESDITEQLSLSMQNGGTRRERKRNAVLLSKKKPRDSMHLSLSKLQEIVKDREAWFVAVHRVTKSLTLLSY